MFASHRAETAGVLCAIAGAGSPAVDDRFLQYGTAHFDTAIGGERRSFADVDSFDAFAAGHREIRSEFPIIS